MNNGYAEQLLNVPYILGEKYFDMHKFAFRIQE